MSTITPTSASVESRRTRRQDGSLTVTAAAAISAPPTHVWRLLADYHYDEGWREGVISMDQSTRGVVVDGTRTDEVFTMLGTRSRNRGVVFGVIDGRRFRWRVTNGTDAEGSRTVAGDGSGGSIVELVLIVRPRGAERLLRPVLRGALRRSLERSLVRFRRLAESTAQPRSSLSTVSTHETASSAETPRARIRST